ncbi:GH3 auxin-responsive promoter [Catalinimonas alkaloidigena]|uniref:GH3 auxin-responsive promoter n=1 Tax=Catalinimonas alkaloidigena TaxID=1075417 RepID=A0A1G9N0Y6_9BACT|nr:GH3 auxin-responsive promoter family protein [Catalinimonas alkaloidigena]SDL79911.1 GH3 auxin-responsive promoter [Catalinimonas alkaloidigena]
MELLNAVLTWFMEKRFRQIEHFRKYPHETQRDVFRQLIEEARPTEWGKKYGYADIDSPETYRERVPISTYEQLSPWIERVLRGEQNVLWPSRIRWFSKSSGTTNARSKFIPVSDESLEECHYKGGKDLLSMYVHNRPDTKLFSGKGLTIGGSLQNNDLAEGTRIGDVSAIIMHNLPIWAQMIRTPSIETALMSDWEPKIERMARETIGENVTSFSGVPTWTIVLIERILELTGKRNILEVWPNLELFAHGAVSFTPYRQLFADLIPSSQMHYMEIYNASEGFFGIQDDLSLPDQLLLLLDYGVYYEFIPTEELGREHPRTLSLDEVELHKNYALVISTNAGLWRYLIGDTVRFTSLSPYRIRISGRTKNFINAFGEEVIVENAEQAIAEACRQTDAVMADFTAAPVYLGTSNRGGHEWIIEFEKEPTDLAQFTHLLDDHLRQINSDYDAKRSHDLALVAPVVHAVPPGTFYNWMKRRGKLGGQHKVPRLFNSRQYVDEIKEMLQEA